jgi:hypothetical protein
MDWIETKLSEIASGLLGLWQRILALGSAILHPNLHWWVLLPAFAIIVLALATVRYRRWKGGWLSGLVAARIRGMQRQKRWRWIESVKSITRRRAYHLMRSAFYRSFESAERYLSKIPNQIRDLYFPSLISSILITLIVLLFFATPHFSAISKSISERTWSDFLSNLDDEESVKKVFEGLIVIAVALIVFVAESIRDTNNPEKKRVLLRISRLWPLTLVVTLFPLGYLAGKLTELTVVLIVLMSIWAIYQFARVIRNLLDPDIQEASRRALLKERTHSLVMDSVIERVGNNILLEKLGPDRDIKIEYTISKSWIESGVDNYIFLDLPQAGWIADININELQSLANLMQQNARKLGFELYGVATVAGVNRRGVQVGPANRQQVPVKKVYLLKRFREQLPPDSIFSVDRRAILAVPKEFEPDRDFLDEIRARLSLIFKCTDAEPSSVAFRREMQATKDQLLAAIRAVALGAVEQLRQTYVQVSEAFLETLHELGGAYSAAQASQEKSNIFEGWNEIRWLVSDIRELMIVSAGTDNTDVISSIAFLPIAVATRAIQAHDHLLFQEFAPFATFIYSLGAQKPLDSSVRAFMTDRSWRYLKNLADFYILPPVQRMDTNVDYGELTDFALFTSRVFQDLLKASFTNQDFSAFQVMLREFVQLFQRFTAETAHPRAALLELQLQLPQIQEDEVARSRLQAQLERQRNREESARRIALARDQVIFGLAAYILDKDIQAQGDPSIQRFFSTIETHLPSDLEQFAAVFESTRDFSVSDYWGWSQWDMVADGQAHFIDLFTNPNRLFCVRALRILAGLSTEAIDRVNLQKLGFLANENNPQGLPATLEAIRSHPEMWQDILSEPELGQIDTLLEILRRARIAEAEAERDAVISAEIDPARLARFKAGVLEGFKSNGRLRPLMQKLQIFRDYSDQGARPRIPSWGFNQLDDKGAFIDQSRVSYGDWGEAYGRGLAQAEDDIGFAAMVENAGIREQIRLRDLMATIDRHVSEQKVSDPIVIQTLNAAFEMEWLNQSSFFIPNYRRDCPQTSLNDLRGFMGVLKFQNQFVPVFDLFVQRQEVTNKLLLADLARYAVFQQFSPIENADDEEYKVDNVLVRVLDLNQRDAQRNKMLQDNPEWLRGQADPERYLRSHVIVNVFEKFKVKVVDQKCGICISIPDAGN